MYYRIIFILSLLCFVDSTTCYGQEEEFILGVCTHFAQRKGQLEQSLTILNRIGIGSIRDEAYWNQIERVKGSLRIPEYLDEYIKKTAQNGTELLLVLGYGNRFYDGGDKPNSLNGQNAFLKYSSFLANHRSEFVSMYEIWNEWEGTVGRTSPGSVEDYLSLIRKVYPELKKKDPTALVLGGSLTSSGIRKGWMKSFLEKGGANYIDGLTMHPYIHSASKASPESWYHWMKQTVENIKEYSGADKPIYITEMGWPSDYLKHGVDEETVALYLARILLLVKTIPEIKGLWWYDFQDDGWNKRKRQDNFGLVRPDLTPKIAFYVISDLANLVRHGKFQERVEFENENIWLLKFTLNKEKILVLWQASKDLMQVLFSLKGNKTGPSSLKIKRLGRSQYLRDLGYRNWTENRDIIEQKKSFSITIDSMPVIIRGDIEAFDVEVVRAIK